MVNILYQSDITWEYDFIIKCIFKNTKYNIIKFKNDELSKLYNYKNSIIIFNTRTTFNNILILIKRITPLILCFMSDELGGINERYIKLANYTKLFLYQYHHPTYSYSDNCFQLPLGYVSSFLDNSLTLKPLNSRKYNASFVGQFKKDIKEMLEIMDKLDKFNNKSTKFLVTNTIWDINKLSINPKDMYKLYSETIFVPIGRENISLNCFRIYEALVAGAIPIIVGSENEIKTTFYYNNRLPPFIYCNSWKNALIKCKRLLKNSKKLNKLQEDIQIWWKDYIDFLHNLIKKVIKK